MPANPRASSQPSAFFERREAAPGATALFGLLACFAMSACQSPTQVLVQVDGDDAVWDRLVELEVRVWAREDDGEESVAAELTIPSPIPRPYRVPLAPLDRDASRRYRVEAVGRLSTDETVIARLISGYVPRQTLRYVLFLDADCVAVRDCSDEETCVNGACRSAEVPPDELCALGDCPDVGAPDAGRDTDAPDTGTSDTGTSDTGMPDTGMPDTGTPDTGTPDTGTPDMGMCPWGETVDCNLRTNDCEDELEQCTPGLDTAGLETGYCEAIGVRALGERCENTFGCLEGLVCARTQDDEVGFCRPPCSVSQPCSCVTGLCVPPAGSTEFGGCFESCPEPEFGGGCVGVTRCGVPHDFSNPVCVRPGTRTRGAGCTRNQDCATGLACGRRAGLIDQCWQVCTMGNPCIPGMCFRPPSAEPDSTYGLCIPM